jgi:FSR family fosmidomycin resistance protein-like MFS transporter
MLLCAAALVGSGSSVFHPESSRISRMASGGQHGLAQSVFQVGGNLGSSLGPLLATLVILPRGQGAIGWCSIAALLAMLVLVAVGIWYGRRRRAAAAAPRAATADSAALPTRRVVWALAILGLLVFSKYAYLTSLTSFYTFYLMAHFHLSTQAAELQLFVFLVAVAAGTVLGGPIGDRVGRKRVIWASILGVAPFTLAMPHVDLMWTEILAVVIGFVLASAFSAILVFAQELVPGRVGMISGMFFGFAFGIAGICAAALGWLADYAGIERVYLICSFLPLLGAATAFLPDLRRTAKA